MFQVLLILQILGIIVLLGEIVYMIPKISGKSHVLMFLFVVEAFVDCVGYLMEISSQTMETAFMGTKVTYVGRAYLILTIFLFVMHFCKINIPKYIVLLMFSFHTFILGLVLFAEHIDLYYTSVTFVEGGMFPHLEFGRGVLYTVYQWLIYLYFAAMIIVLIGKLITNKIKSERKKTLVLLSILGVCVVSFFLYAIGVTGGYDALCLGLVISALILLFGIFRCDMLSTIDSAKGFIVDNMDTGVVVFDEMNNLLYNNSIALKLFPDLIAKSDEVYARIDEYCSSGDKIFSGERVYMVRKEDGNKSENAQVYIFPNITNTYNYMGRLEREVNEKTCEIKKIQHAIIVSFANIVETRDGFTGQHIKNTSHYVSIIARALYRKNPELISEQDVASMVEAAPLHDIGKISIPDAILCKPGKLTSEEYETMKTHSEVGAHVISDILNDIGQSRYLELAKEMAYYHHEKWNGSGYPCGLSGEEIPLCARIMAVADVYDALRSRRCYKDGMSKEQALEIIKEGSGNHFDPDIVNIFVENIEEIEAC